MRSRNIITKNINDIVKSSASKANTITDPNIIIDLPEIDFSKFNISVDPILVDSSDNNFVISIYSENYSFITKKQGKKLIGSGRRISTALSIKIADILFSEEVEDFSEISSDEDKDLSD